ncbi:hypothetical protein KFE25_010519 [Diacronema lutheri]|uniref:Methyltransferase n=1 Tax=Diacronema lutheri TaxID=2081491 RepID=A0A8J6C432_DIALT|nr:hypothetical protein KFE25_010519 [Diacronema lutheri]
MGAQACGAVVGRKRARATAAALARAPRALVENEPGLCASVGRAHAALLRAGGQAWLWRAPDCDCAEAPPGGGLDIVAHSARAGASAAKLAELRVDGDSAEREIGDPPHRWITNVSCESLWLRAAGRRWLLPARSACVVSAMREWQDALARIRPADGFELVVLDPPWPSHSAQRARAYETVDVRRVLASHVRLGPLLSDVGSVVIVWCTNNKALSDWVVHALFPEWGLRHVATWFWLKLTAGAGELVTGSVDSPHRKPWEPMLLGVRGAPDWADRLPARRVICACPVGHSVKPPLEAIVRQHVRERSFAPDGTKLELFARELRTGWCSAGDQAVALQAEGWYCARARSSPPPPGVGG